MQTIDKPLNEQDDLLLLRRFSDTGDSNIFAEIVRRYAGVVFSASNRVLNDASRAQDVSQETFYRLLRQPRLVTHSLGGWLHQSATRLAIDARRSELSRRNRERTYWIRQEAERNLEPKWEDISSHVDQSLIDLQEPNRTLLVRHFLQGTPQSQLATEMNMSPATISRKIRAGVEELQKLLKKKGIYIGLIALTDLCIKETAKAAPRELLCELGKMQMVGPVTIGPVPPPNPPVLWPSTMKLASHASSTPTFALSSKVLTFAGLGVTALAVAGVVNLLRGDHPGPAPAPTAPSVHVDPKPTQAGPMHITLPLSSLGNAITSIDTGGPAGDPVTLNYRDGRTQTMTWNDAQDLIRNQTGKSIDQLLQSTPTTNP